MDEHLTETGQETPEYDSERYVSYKLTDLWPEWQAEARCNDVGTDYYFGNDDLQPTMSIAQVRRAAKLCDVCPVYDECLRHALTKREEYGVWAGTSGRVRRKLFKLLDTGEADVDQIIKAVRYERDQRGRQPASPLNPVAGRDHLRDEADGTVAL